MDLQFFGGRGASSGKKGTPRMGYNGPSNKPTESQGEMIHGVSKAQIDQLRGTREHEVFALDYSQQVQTVKSDYERVGIKISDEYAADVRDSVHNFSGDDYKPMRKALIAEREGKTLTENEKEYLRQYRLCEEYCKIAPTFKESDITMIHRGIPYDSSDYVKGLLSLKPGQTWDVDRMPTSFSTLEGKAQGFAHSKGIVIHAPVSALKDSPSIKGLSEYSEEHEVFVSDYDNWRVKSVSDQRNSGSGYYEITLEPNI